MKKILIILAASALVLLSACNAGQTVSIPDNTGVAVNTEGSVLSVMDQAQKLYASGDYEGSADLIRQAADLGDPAAQCAMGDCYNYGMGVDRDEKKAVEYYLKSANQGYVPAQAMIGCAYLIGMDVGIDPETVLNKYLLPAAEKGEPVGQYYAGYCYDNGTIVEKDAKKAVEYYRLSAAQGFPEAQNRLGECYQSGIGVDVNTEEAVKWYLMSAEQGFPDALFNLGDCYFEGKGTTKDLNMAAELYRKALDSGYEPDETDKEHMTAVGLSAT